MVTDVSLSQACTTMLRTTLNVPETMLGYSCQPLGAVLSLRLYVFFRQAVRRLHLIEHSLCRCSLVRRTCPKDGVGPASCCSSLLQARDLLQHLWTGPISNAPVDIVQGSKSVEVRPVGISKVSKHATDAYLHMCC